MRISVINLTKGRARLSQKSVANVIRAINRQLREDFAPYWHIHAELRLDSSASERPGDSAHPSMRGDAILYLTSDPAEGDYLGYHATHLTGVPFGVVCTKVSQDLGEDWSVTLSHEALELVADPEVNLVCKGPHPDPTKAYEVFHWRELCDAVQDEVYEIDDVKVANFLLPLYFTGSDELDGRNDFLDLQKGGRLRSFRVKSGGYAGFFDPITGRDETFEADERARKRALAKNRLIGVRRKDRRTLDRAGASPSMASLLPPSGRKGAGHPSARFEGYFLQVEPPPTPGGDPGVAALALAGRIISEELGATWTVKPFWSAPSPRGQVKPVGDIFVEPHGPVSVANAWQGLYALRDNRDVVYAEPLFEAQLAPAIQVRTLRASGAGQTHLPGTEDCEWHLELIRARDGWSQSNRGRGIRIGHPDTGYTRHSEIYPALDVASGWDFLGEDADSLDDREDHLGVEFPGHGTGTASVIVSPEGSPRARPEFVTGVAPAAQLVPLRVSRSVVLLSMRRLAAAIRYAADQDLPVISISMGGLWSHALHAAVRYATERGTIICAAAGNEVRFVVWPAAYDEVVAVAACNINREPWRGTSSGDAVDVTAPGESVWRATAERGDDSLTRVSRGSGTSFAVAQVAGAAALWLGRHGRDALIERYGAAGVPAVFKELLAKTARPEPALPNDRYGAGLLDVGKLLDEPLPATPPAHGMRRGSIVAVPPRAGSFALLAHVVPEASRAALSKATRSLLTCNEDDLAARLAELGEELAWHLAVDANLRQALLERLASPASAVEPEPPRGAAQTRETKRRAARKADASELKEAARNAPRGSLDLAYAVDRLAAFGSSRLRERLPSGALIGVELASKLCLRPGRSSGRPRRGYQVEGPWNVGDPVHETLTLHALRSSRVVGEDANFDDSSVWEFIRGAFWNDDPLGLLFDDNDQRTDDFSSGIEFACHFKRFEAAAADGAFYGPGDSLLARSHFGDLQFLHAMAARDGESPATTRDAILTWAEFVWPIATGKHAEATRLDAVASPEVARLRLASGETTIGTLFRCVGPARLAERALGSLLHVVQDSYASGHVARERIADDHKGAVRMFFSYAHQDHEEHDSFDKWPEGKDEGERLRKLPGGLDAVAACGRVVEMWRKSAPVSELIRLLSDNIFVLSDRAVVAGPKEPK